MTTENQNTQSKPAAQALSAPAGSVFELVDCTNDENYFPMGLFLSLEDALAQVKDREEPPTDDPEEFVRMEVRERQIGKLRWWDNGETVATIQWIQDYIEAKWTRADNQYAYENTTTIKSCAACSRSHAPAGSVVVDTETQGKARHNKLQQWENRVHREGPS